MHKSAKLNDFGLSKSGSAKFNSSGSKSSVTSSGDRRLAQSAQMYHYQHQKQQMIAMEKAAANANDAHRPDNSDNSDCEAEEGDWTVYECPGLAPVNKIQHEIFCFTFIDSIYIFFCFVSCSFEDRRNGGQKSVVQRRILVAHDRRVDAARLFDSDFKAARRETSSDRFGYKRRADRVANDH